MTVGIEIVGSAQEAYEKLYLVQVAPLGRLFSRPCASSPLLPRLNGNEGPRRAASGTEPGDRTLWSALWGSALQLNVRRVVTKLV